METLPLWFLCEASVLPHKSSEVVFKIAYKCLFLSSRHEQREKTKFDFIVGITKFEQTNGCEWSLKFSGKPQELHYEVVAFFIDVISLLDKRFWSNKSRSQTPHHDAAIVHREKKNQFVIKATKSFGENLLLPPEWVDAKRTFAKKLTEFACIESESNAPFQIRLN